MVTELKEQLETAHNALEQRRAEIDGLTGAQEQLKRRVAALQEVRR
jgi:hypothetical protein